MARSDPWAAFADEVTPSRADDAVAGPVDQPVDQPDPSAIAAPGQPPAQDEFAQVAEPAQPVGDFVPAATEFAFNDQLPQESTRKLDPEQESEVLRLLHQSAEQGGDGSAARRYVASLWGPGSEDNFDEVVDALKKGGKVTQAVDVKLPKIDNEDGAAGSAARGAADAVTVGAMPKMTAAYAATEDWVNGKGDWGDRYDMNLDQQRGMIEGDERDHPLARVTGQLLGGLAIPAGLEGVGYKAGSAALKEGLSMDEARAIASHAVRTRMAKTGGAYGATHGAMGGDTPEEMAIGALEEGAIGAAGGAVAGTVTGKLAERGAAKAAAARAAPLTEEQELIRAADRQGVDVLPADVGGPVTRRATGMIAQTIAGGAPVIKASQRMHGQAEAARDRVASAIGKALEPESAGNEARVGAEKAIQSTRDEARAFYADAEKASKDQGVPATKALDALNRNIAELKDTPGGAPGLATLESIRDSMLRLSRGANGGRGNVSVAGIRRMRTVMRDQFIKDGLTGSDLERRVGQVMDAAAEDVADGLTASGKPDVATLFKQGDAAWRKRAELIDRTFKPILGNKDNPRSGEQIIKTLTADLQNNNARAVKFLQALPAKEQANVRASIIGAMGREKAGKQGSEGANFSLETFLTHWNQVGERAKVAYFGPEGRAALNDLAQIAEGAREAQGYRNFSNTGGAVGNILTAMSGIGGLATFGKTIAVQYGLGRLLASPRFARWLARAPRTKLSNAAYADQLTRIARAEPAIADDVLGLRDAILHAANENVPSRAAASGGDDEQDGDQ